MTLIENTVPQVSVSGRQEERFFAPERPDAFWSRSRFIALVALVLIIHASVIGYFLYRDATAPTPAPAAEETPVEVVQEPPPPPPPPQQQKKQPPPPEPKQQPNQDMSEKPASSAPRAPSETAVDTKMTDAKTEAAKTAAPPRDGQADPAKAAATAREQPAAPQPKTAAAPKLEDDKRDAEALDKLKPDLEDKPDAEEAKADPKTQATEAARQRSGLSDVEVNRFAATSKMQDFPPGTEDNRYFAIVYGKIMSKNRYPTSAAARHGEHGIVSVTFVVNYMGNIERQEVTESSGQPHLDAIAMATVRAAAPFPFPPGSGSLVLIWRADFEP
ncbi:TonB family protein [Beijerinckia sp. L45]|uniref:TonB family protein n=1 Tax=Beijerinckia sp. L45 TaxID=1641855 RepID=UPI00131E558A|nr:energy transducer TonB [Beijerinckia sp. L45]